MGNEKGAPSPRRGRAMEGAQGGFKGSPLPHRQWEVMREARGLFRGEPPSQAGESQGGLRPHGAGGGAEGAPSLPAGVWGQGQGWGDPGVFRGIPARAGRAHTPVPAPPPLPAPAPRARPRRFIHKSTRRVLVNGAVPTTPPHPPPPCCPHCPQPLSPSAPRSPLPAPSTAAAGRAPLPARARCPVPRYLRRRAATWRRCGCRGARGALAAARL